MSRHGCFFTQPFTLTSLLMLSSMSFYQGSAIKSSSIIRLATTTSTQNSGLLQNILPEFEKHSSYQVHVIAVGTGKALRMGKDSDVDVLIVHAPLAEQQFNQAGYGKKCYDVMYNDIVLVGPEA